MSSSALCVIAKNEGSYIAEWLAHHLALGFDRVLVFDNESTDCTRTELRRMERIAPIEVRHWPRANWSNVQIAAYEQACRDLAGKVEWIAFLDVDEFLISLPGEPLADLLARHGSTAGIAVNWLMFGTSGHEQRPDGLVLESFLMRSTIDFTPNQHIKSIVRPETVRACLNGHFFDLDGAYRHPSGQLVVWEIPGKAAGLPEIDNWRIHHYFTRHRAAWAAKVAKGRVARDAPQRTAHEFDYHNRNDVHDPAALRYVPAIRATLDRIAS